MTQKTSCTGNTMDISHDTYFYTEMFVVEAGKMQNRRAVVYTCKECSKYSDNGNSVNSKV